MGNIFVRIDYVTNENMVTQKGSFMSRGRSVEKVAFDFWRQIKRSMPFQCELVKVITNEGLEITDKVKELEEAPLE